MKTEILFLIAGSSLIGILIIISVLFVCIRRSKSTSFPEEEHSESFSFMPGEYTCQKIPIKQIYSATNNLNHFNFIGQGIAGKVYKGVLSNGCHVAIKHIIKDAQMETFVREVTSLSHVRHPNLVSLHGYCEKDDERFLVYELCACGSLSDWLFGKEKFLTWVQRLEIAVGSAHGLLFLHTYPGGCIVHRDVKPSNILLDSDLKAKLSDFGLSKLIDVGVSFVSSEVRGSYGYIDPEYLADHHVHAAGDVYSFGIVLLQMLSGKKAINLNYNEPFQLNKMAKLVLRSGNASEFADPRLCGEYPNDAFSMVLKVALSCTTYKNKRPSMEQVVKRLETALNLSKRVCTHEQNGVNLDHALKVQE